WEGPWRGSVLVRDCSGAERPLPGHAVVLGNGQDAVVALFLRPEQLHETPDAQAPVEQVASRELQAARASADDASRALRESEARFRGAFDASAMGMALVGMNGGFLQ